ncbi:MAG: carboxypeptidase-like regulatory domain-containing protein [Acidobacteriota bacterium]
MSIELKAPGSLTEWLELSESDRAKTRSPEHVVELTPEGRLTGFLETPNGFSPEQVELVIQELNGREVHRIDQRTNDGAFDFEQLEPGAWRIELSSPGHSDRHVVDELVLPPGQTVDLGRVEITGLTVRGVVLDDEGDPIEGARVGAHRRNEPFRGRVTTGVDGSFEIAELPKRDLILRIGHPSHPPKRFEPQPHELMGELELVLDSGGEIRGVVLDDDENPWSSREVEVRWSGGPTPRWKSTKTDEDGRYVLRGIRPGAVSVECQDVTKKVELESGDELEVDFVPGGVMLRATIHSGLPPTIGTAWLHRVPEDELVRDFIGIERTVGGDDHLWVGRVEEGDYRLLLQFRIPLQLKIPDTPWPLHEKHGLLYFTDPFTLPGSGEVELQVHLQPFPVQVTSTGCEPGEALFYWLTQPGQPTIPFLPPIVEHWLWCGQAATVVVPTSGLYEFHVGKGAPVPESEVGVRTVDLRPGSVLQVDFQRPGG